MNIDLETYLLPCDVRVPPATVICAGCTLETLLIAMENKYRPRKFGEVPDRDEIATMLTDTSVG